MKTKHASLLSHKYFVAICSSYRAIRLHSTIPVVARLHQQTKQSPNLSH